MKDFVQEELQNIYTQDDEAPRFQPTWINKHLYIFGRQHGVVLWERGTNDPHIMIKVIGEDDGNWFETKSLGSSYWLEDFKKVLVCLQDWLNNNAIKHEWGYNFK